VGSRENKKSKGEQRGLRDRVLESGDRWESKLNGGLNEGLN
jgi:hypothetical protein